MSKKNKRVGIAGKPIKKPIASQFFHRAQRDGITIQIFTTYDKMIFNVYIFPTLGKFVQIVLPPKEFLQYSLSDLIDRAVMKAQEFLPASNSLSPKPIEL